MLVNVGMARGHPHSPQTKATALAALATGESVSSVARRLGISRTTATMWRDAAGLNETTGVVHEKKAAIGEQVYAYLEESIATLDHQVRCMRDEAWLKQQSAAGLAMLHGVLFDKMWRLAAALQPSSNVDEH